MAPKRRDNKGRILQIGEWKEPMILKNPFDFEMRTVINNDSNKREAISPQD